MSEGLKPCPFCSGPTTYTRGNTVRHDAKPECPLSQRGGFFTIDAAWNTRAEGEEIRRLREVVADQEAAIQTLYRERDALERVASQYAYHRPDCLTLHIDGERCDCLFDEARAALEKARGK